MDLNLLRLANIIAWSLLAAFMASGAWAAAHARDTRRGDPMRLACFATALLMIGYSALGIVAPGENVARGILHVLAIADAGLIWRLGKAYGRGPRV